jgi:ankyrin repeat protein
MVHAAQMNNEFLMKNLINNAIACNHEDALDLILNFIPQEVTIFQSIEFYNRYVSPSENSITIENDINKDIITVLKKGNKKTENFFSKNNDIKIGIAKRRHEMFQDVHSFFPQIMALYKADKTMIDQYICTIYDLKNPEYIIRKKITPLQVAACFNSVAMVELLLLNGHEKQVNDADIQGNTPLYLTDDTDVVTILLKCKNIQANKQSKEGKTPLYKAVCQRKQPLIDLFLAHPNFIINEEDENQLTPLHIAARRGDKIAFEFFLKHTEGKVRNTTKPIHYAAAFGHSDIIDIILKKDISQLNIQNNVGETPLLLASTYNQLFAVDILINEGAMVDLAEQNNITPLWIASQNGCDNAVLLLIKGKANVNALSNDKVTPLWKAAQNGKTQIVRWLLENHAFVDHADEDGVTSLIMASQKGYTVIVKLLLKFGANPALQTSDGITALDVAYSDEIEELLKEALKKLIS